MLVRGYWLSLGVYALLLGGLLLLNRPILALVLPFLLYLFYGILLAPGQIRLVVERELSGERVGPHTPIQVTLHIHNTGADLNELHLADALPRGLEVSEGSVRRVTTLRHGESLRWTYTVHGPRGHYTFEGLQAETGAPFGLVRRTAWLDCPAQMFVLPGALKLKQISIRPRRTRVYAGNIPANLGGSGIDFFDVREYQPGDSERKINWRASARLQEGLYSSDFQQERVADIGIILDGRLASNQVGESLGLFDASVLAAATLSDAFLAQGNRVSLLLYGEFLRWTLPGYGHIQRERILRALTQAKPGQSQIFTYLKYVPTRMFPPQSQIVLVSPLLEEDLETLTLFQALGYPLMVISPDPVAYELSQLAPTPQTQLAGRVLALERTRMIHKIRRTGIQVMNWNTQEPFDQVFNAEMRRQAPVVRPLGGAAR